MSTIGFTLPFSRSSGSIGYFELSRTELDAVKNNLKSLLLTNWGERVNHYNLGCNLIEFLFENDRGEDLKERISDRIISQVTTWMPFVQINDLKIVFSEDDSSLPDYTIQVKMKFSLVNRPDITQVLEVPIFP